MTDLDEGRPSARVMAAATSVLVVVGVKTALSAFPGPPQDAPTRTEAVVVAVVDGIVDGDTLQARTMLGRELGRIRLLGIDAPEVDHPPKPAECYADTATDMLADLAPVGSTVRLVSDPTQADRDSYGRLLRYVDHDGEDIALELLTAGAVRLYESDPGMRRSGYEDAAELARDRGRGLWSRC